MIRISSVLDSDLDAALLQEALERAGLGAGDSGHGIWLREAGHEPWTPCHASAQHHDRSRSQRHRTGAQMSRAQYRCAIPQEKQVGFDGHKEQSRRAEDWSRRSPASACDAS
eukprot:1991642-Rhodomonas_salina.1